MPTTRLPLYTRPAGLFGLLFPPTCVLCGAPGDDDLDLCWGCRQELPDLGPACVRCALPLPALPSAPTDTDGPLCGPCRRKPPPFARAPCRVSLRTARAGTGGRTQVRRPAQHAAADGPIAGGVIGGVGSVARG
ncbi:double zinc ribbon domain-containing protein [Thiohalocapsa sp.]|uniref:double zinc ribbon domain-containing protein n=1 Tax=Thiohalocapsa sp. TaxID=2497641 RepID=UPI00345BFA76